MTLVGGKKVGIVMGVEATYGTDPAAYDTIGMLQGEPAVTVNNQLVNIFAGGRINSRSILAGPNLVSGRFDYFVQDGQLIAASIGTFDTTSPVTNTSNFIHYGASEDSTSTVGTPVEYEAESYTMKYGLGATASKNLTITGCKTNSITLTLGLDEPLRASVEWIGKTIATDTDVQTATEIAYGPYMYHDKGTINYAGTPLTILTSLSVNVNNNLHRVHSALPASAPRDITALNQGNRTITGSFTVLYDTAEVEFADVLDNSEVDIDFLLDNESVVTVVGYRGIFVDIKKAKLNTLGDRTHPVDGTPVTETFTFTAKQIDCKYYDATASDPW